MAIEKPNFQHCKKLFTPTESSLVRSYISKVMVYVFTQFQSVKIIWLALLKFISHPCLGRNWISWEKFRSKSNLINHYELSSGNFLFMQMYTCMLPEYSLYIKFEQLLLELARLEVEVQAEQKRHHSSFCISYMMPIYHGILCERSFFIL